MDELDLTGMTWYGALVAVIMLMVMWMKKRKRRFDTAGHTRSQVEELVREAVLSERDRAVILRRLIDNLSMERLAEEFDLSVSQTKRIVYDAEDAMVRLERQK